ncbi:MAG: BolA family transcriptional regulator [Chromatiales bacterium]|nr:BolA family transcriptional regulator [Chromatiales bacterium]
MIRERLSAGLDVLSLDIVDESHKHAGHRGAIESGGGHFRVRVVARDFAGRTPIQRHRLVYAALGDAMQTDIHALSIQAFAPDEPTSPET